MNIKLYLHSALFMVASLASAATLTVTNTADSGPGTLRQAVLDANADASPDLVTIEFNIPGAGIQTIAPLTALPTITRPVTIDGYTQPGTSANTLAAGDNAVLFIQLTGTNAAVQPGVFLQAGSDGSTVRGLVINGFSSNGGIYLLGSSSNVIAGNFIGTSATGQTNLANYDGVDIQTSSFNTIGGSTPAARNVISGNGASGVYYYGPCASNLVQGNFIGTDVTGTNALGNIYGVVVYGDGSNLIGGMSAAKRNIISGNSSYAISVETPGTVVQGNFIGTDVTGKHAVPNANGVGISNGSGCLIGGTAVGAGNLISGNAGDGIGINSPSNTIQGNFIGVDVTGTNALGNAGFGISANLAASGTLIGGTTPGARNVIARNGHGIGIYSGTNSVIQGNYIGTDATGTTGLGNSGYGIYLGADVSGTLIGGTAPGAANLVSGSGYDGVYVGSPGTTVQGNFIGTDVTGTNSLFNGSSYSGIAIGASAPSTQVGGTNTAARNVIAGSTGIALYSPSNTCQGNFVGIGADGLTIVGSPINGISVSSEENLVGGEGAGAGNVVSGHSGDGIRILQGANNVVQGNLIGTDATGTLARGNHNNGIFIYFAPGNLIGGLTAGARNLISGNAIGLTVSGNAATGNTIQGNFIGTDATGTNALANTTQGISIEEAPANLVGGTTPAVRNVVSGNGGYGLGIVYDGASNNIVQGNYFGLGADGITPVPNYAGVRVLLTSGNLIGGSAPGAGNWIAYQASHGISLLGAGATNNAILGNRIFANGTLGIDLGEDGVTANDPGDADDGPNHLQNSPELASAALVVGDLAVSYRGDSAAANSAYPLTVEFFIADANGQGKTFIHRDTYSTPQAFSSITFTPTSPVSEGEPIVATATDANGNTSEFSSAVAVTKNHAPIVANPIPDQTATNGFAFSYQFPANAFSDPDAGNALSYTAANLPPGIVFDGPTRTLSGTPTNAGHFSVTLTATDNGTPSLSVDDTFQFNVARAPLVVTSLGENGPGTLRQAIADALAGDQITFSVTGTITLQTPSQPLLVDKAITIEGPGATNLTIQVVNVYSRILEVTAGPTKISGVTLSGGNTYNFNLTDPEGAAIRNSAQLTLDACELVNNVALGFGGAIWSKGVAATLTVINCTFAGNYASPAYTYVEAGGAIWLDGVLHATNCTFSGNYAAAYGGAIYSSGNAVISSSTLTRNLTGYYGVSGGGIQNDGGSLTLLNSIVAGNTNNAYYLDAQDVGGFITSGDYNLIGYTNNLAVPGTHNLLGIDPQLGSLHDNGGPTRTHGLASTSPALDAADAATSPPTDQRGVARPQNAGYDIGAFEGALPVNHPPVLDNPIATLTAVFGDSLNYTVPADTFSDPDAGQTLTYSMAGSPVAYFDPATRTILGSFLQPGTNTFTVTATDDGAPPLSASVDIELIVSKRPITVRADDQCRPYGDPNPPLTLTYFGLVSDLSFLTPPTAATVADSSSPPGSYAIGLSGGASDYYDFVGLTNGTLTVGNFSVDYQVIRSFGFTNQMGINPNAKVIEGSDGVLYGTTSDVIYRINRDGTGYQVLRFISASAPLREFSDGALYGTTTYGGTSGYGTLFRLNKDGSGFTLLHNFTDEVNDGSYPSTQLLQGSDGLIYGTARRVFSMNTNGTGYTIVHRFTIATDGAGLTAPLMEGTDGSLYGETSSGGPSNAGAIFKVNKDGSGFQVLHAFVSGNYFPNTAPQGLVEGGDGALYGAATPDDPQSIIFKLNKDGSGYTVLHTFAAYTYPRGTLVDSGGRLYGVEYYGGSLFQLNEDGTGYSDFLPIDSSLGVSPVGVTLGSDGLLYVATSGNGVGPAGQGALFSVNTDGTGATVLWRFNSSGGDVFYPSTSLIEATNGRLYGGTADGPVFGLNKNGGGPAVLQSSANRALLQGSDGALYGLQAVDYGTSYLSRANLDGSSASNFFNLPASAGSYFSSLNEGSGDALYGTAGSGGDLGGGTLFKANKHGNGFQILTNFTLDYFSFSNPPHNPQYVFADSDGKLYGICIAGGGPVGNSSVGSVFSINADGSSYTNLHVFDASGDLSRPNGRLIEGSDGRLYGTAGGGVFGLNKDGSGYSVVFRFPSQDQISPNGVTEGSDGFLYGFGLGYDPYPLTPIVYGSIYRLRKDGSEYCVVHRFDATSGAESWPVGWPLKGSDGAFYGAASRGGASAFGAVFRFTTSPVLLNHSATLDHPIPDQPGSYGTPFNFTFAANTFSDPDAGQLLSYGASGLPPGTFLDGPSRTFSGTPTNAGTFSVMVTATDDGTPQLSTNDPFNIVVAKAALTVSANNTNRPYGAANPLFTGSLVGVTNNDSVTAAFDTTATPNSAPGNYPITPELQDPDGKLGNYNVTTNLGTLTVEGVNMSVSTAGGSSTFCWPTNAAGFGLECTDSLTPPITWNAITSGIVTNGSTICYTVTPAPATPRRFYRLHLP